MLRDWWRGNSLGQGHQGRTYNKDSVVSPRKNSLFSEPVLIGVLVSQRSFEMLLDSGTDSFLFLFIMPLLI